MGSIDDITVITADDLRRFIVALKGKTAWESLAQGTGKSLSPTTINTYVRAVKSFWSWLKENGTITNNALADVPAPRIPKRLPKVYSEEELKAILRSVSRYPRKRAIIELLLDSGIRLSELSSLMVGDLDTGTGRVKVFGKGSKERYTYISSAAALSIHNYIHNVRPEPESEDWLFLTVAGYPLTARRVQKVLEVIGHKAGLRIRLSAHKLRHTYATLCLKNGNNLEYVRITLGHSDIKTTSDAYLVASDTDVAKACKRYSPLANLSKGTGPRNSAVARRAGE